MPDDSAKTVADDDEYAAQAHADAIERERGRDPPGASSGPHGHARAEAVERASGGTKD